MSRARAIAAAALFLAATCVKLFLPAWAVGFCSGLHSAVDSGQELRAAMVTLGESLTAEEEELVAALGLLRGKETLDPSPTPTESPSPTPEATAYDPPQLTALRTEKKARLGRVSAPTPEPDASPEPEPEPTPAAVTQFLEAQSAYEGYAIPANVNCAMPALGLSYVSPVSGASSSGFGYRVHPLSGEVKFHYGTDFAVWTGTEVCCFADGCVAFAGEEAGYGKYLIVDHADGCRTLYAHCSSLLVSAGEQVAAGQVIAKSGDTGRVTGPHLHFELQRDGLYLNPEYYVGVSG